MVTATRTIENRSIQADQDQSSRRGMRSELGYAVMRPLRRAAISLLGMRTEFEVGAPEEDWDPDNSGPPPVVRPTTMGRVRRAASSLLDPWTEFEELD